MAQEADVGHGGGLVDANVHLWDQARNPVFWLSDRTSLRGMLGDYDSLPDRYTVADYVEATARRPVEGLIWSDPGADDPLAAIADVRSQDERGLVLGIVALGDPTSDGFPRIVAEVGEDPLVTSVRIRIADGFGGAEERGLGVEELVHRLRPLADAGLVATIEASADRLPEVCRLARQLPELRIIVDHFGWPDDHSDEGRAQHVDRLAALAEQPNVATRIDAIGTIFGDWTTDEIRPWLQSTVEVFGAHRCMLGSDLPIETLRSSFERLYDAYEEIFATCSRHEHDQLFGATARTWLGAAG